MGTLLIDEVPLMVQPSLAKALGLNQAIFLQQVHYWLSRSRHVHDGQSWIYNTYEEWNRQRPFFSVRTIKRIIAELERDGYIVSTTKYNTQGFDRKKWYTINYARMEALETELMERRRQEIHAMAMASLGGEEGEETGGTTIVPDWPNEENQGFAGSFSENGDALPTHDKAELAPDNKNEETSAKTSGTTIVPNWPNEESQGVAGFSASPSCQNGPMHRANLTQCIVPNWPDDSANLAQAITREYKHRLTHKTTTTASEVVALPDYLLELTAGLGIGAPMLNALAARYGQERVKEQALLLSRKAGQGGIKNPAGWLRAALEQGFEDSEAAYESCREEKRQAAREENAALCARMRELTLSEAKAIGSDRAEVAPEFARFRRHDSAAV